MRRRLAISMAALLGLAMATLDGGPSEAKQTITRSERCSELGQQLDKTIKSTKPSKQTTEAKALQRKATKLCAEKKEAQGLRALANGLKLLGAKPIDP